MAEAYRSTNDRWRKYGYEKAIRIVSTLPKPISTKEELLAIRGIGRRLADKIWEIVEWGKLRKAEQFAHSDKVQVLFLMRAMGVHIGYSAMRLTNKCVEY